MSFKKGHQKISNSGRKPGSVNKLTQTVKQAFEIAFEQMQGEKNTNLLEWGKKNPTDFYKIASKLIPSEMNAKLSGGVKVDGTVTFIRPNNNV